MTDYDTALFHQILKEKLDPPDKTHVTYPEIEEAFWRCSPVLEDAILDQAGEDALEAGKDHFREALLPELVEGLRLEGWVVTPA